MEKLQMDSLCHKTIISKIKTMTIASVKKYFLDKEYVPCPLTEKLVKAGYHQVSGGYIDRAMREGMVVDYKNNLPSQYWHLMTYCNSRNNDNQFSKRIVCGELIVWMAEVSGAVKNHVLEDLVNTIIDNAINHEGQRPTYDRIKWNKTIQNICFDKITIKVE